MIVMIDNYDSFTYNLVQYFFDLGAEVQVYRNDALTVAEVLALKPAGIVVSPGPGRPSEAGISIELIRAVAGKVPLLGVCLGHQAMAEAFGGEVIGAKAIMHGKVSEVEHDGKGVFAKIKSPMKATRYHSLAVRESSLPAEFEVSARTADGEVMGMRHRTLPLEGVQFHPESVLTPSGKRLLANFLATCGEGSSEVKE